MPHVKLTPTESNSCPDSVWGSRFPTVNVLALTQLVRDDPVAFFEARSELVSIAVTPRHPGEADLSTFQDKIDEMRATCVSPALTFRLLADCLVEHLELLEQSLSTLEMMLKNELAAPASTKPPTECCPLKP